MKVIWQRRAFDGLSASELHDVLQLRQQVFVVEQNCAFLDIDGADCVSHHLLGWSSGDGKRKLVAYARIVPAGRYHGFPDPCIGRLATASSVRGTGLGRQLMQRAIEYLLELYPRSSIRIQAQHYLETFYQSFGFRTLTEPYDEDGIPHVDMLRPGQ